MRIIFRFVSLVFTIFLGHKQALHLCQDKSLSPGKKKESMQRFKGLLKEEKWLFCKKSVIYMEDLPPQVLTWKAVCFSLVWMIPSIPQLCALYPSLQAVKGPHGDPTPCPINQLIDGMGGKAFYHGENSPGALGGFQPHENVPLPSQPPNQLTDGMGIFLQLETSERFLTIGEEPLPHALFQFNPEMCSSESQGHLGLEPSQSLSFKCHPVAILQPLELGKISSPQFPAPKTLNATPTTQLSGMGSDFKTFRVGNWGSYSWPSSQNPGL